MINQQDQSNLGRFHRRNFLRGISLSFISTALGMSRGSAQESPSRGAPELVNGLIVRQRKPDNLEFPFTTLDTFITPNEKFYIRNHFEQPMISHVLPVDVTIR